MSKGSCLCGTVKFTVTGNTSNMNHCHCSMCRKIHGSLFATYFNAEALEITEGSEAIGRYESSPGFTRTFCTQCGSTLPEQSHSDNGVFVPAGLMDDDPGVRPEAHIFTESKAECYAISDSLPQHEHYGDGNMDRVVDVPEPTTKDGVVSGNCQCGEVAYEYTGTPKMMMNCHCTRCRKVKGAAHATNVFVAGEFFGHSFCKTCGSSVPRPRPDGSVFNIPAGGLNQHPGIEAKGHIFVGSKAPWFDVTEDKPQWDEMPT